MVQPIRKYKILGAIFCQNAKNQIKKGIFFVAIFSYFLLIVSTNPEK
jgi:hypothetical protein